MVNDTAEGGGKLCNNFLSVAMKEINRKHNKLLKMQQVVFLIRGKGRLNLKGDGLNWIIKVLKFNILILCKLIHLIQVWLFPLVILSN